MPGFVGQRSSSARGSARMKAVSGELALTAVCRASWRGRSWEAGADSSKSTGTWSLRMKYSRVLHISAHMKHPAGGTRSAQGIRWHFTDTCVHLQSITGGQGQQFTLQIRDRVRFSETSGLRAREQQALDLQSLLRCCTGRHGKNKKWTRQQQSLAKRKWEGKGVLRFVPHSVSMTTKVLSSTHR